MFKINNKIRWILLWFIFCAGCLPTQRQNQVCFDDNQCIDVEIAQTQGERQRGLQFRRFLKSDEGMLFIFDTSGRHSFWMKNTWIPLDVIWMDDERRIVYIEHNVPPCDIDPCPRYAPDKFAFYVLEINAGVANRLGIQLDQRAEFYFFGR
jgi:uncharacterized protein